MTFDLSSLLVDLVIAISMLICTYITCRHIENHDFKFSIADAFAAVAGFAMVFALVTGTYVSMFELAFFSTPIPGMSVMDGETRPFGKFPMLLISPMAIGAFSIGFASTRGILRFANKTPTTESVG